MSLEEESRWSKWRWLKGWRRSYSVLLVVLLAALLRAWAAWQLPVDFDEPVYLTAGRQYAHLMQSGDWSGVIDYAENREHPALVKLLYSLPYWFMDEQFGQMSQLYFDRGISALFGVLTVLLVALLDPLAGLLLAAHSMTIKYTSQAYLEALPLFLALVAVLALRRGIQQPMASRRWWWLLLSAASFGAAIAGKYTYGMAVVTLAFVWWREGRGRLRWIHLLAYGGLALVIFGLLNPYLWRDPFVRLWQSLFFHTQYAQGTDVLRAAYPWYQPFVWIFFEVPWHPQVFFFPTSDTLVAILALLGVGVGGKKYPWALVWAGTGLLVLLVWPTKWPQYTIVLTPALALLAATLVRRVVKWIGVQESYWNYLEEMLPRPPRLFWILVFGLSLLVVIGKVAYEFNLAVLRQGWLQVVMDVSPLPSNQVYDVAVNDVGTVYLATANGLAVWKPEAGSPWGTGAQTVQLGKLGLDGTEALTVLASRDGTVWVGTDNGVLHWRGGVDWQTFNMAQMGIRPGRVLALEQSADGRVWVGATTGVAMWDGTSWTALPVGEIGLLDESVFCIAAEDGRVWFGSLYGVTLLDLTKEQWSWQQFDFRSLGLGWGGVADVMVDSHGVVWAATLGGGLGVWDGVEWNFYRTSNSQLPFNTVHKIVEVQPDVYWLGVGYPTEPGGMMVRLDRRAGAQAERWRVYLPNNSGYQGQEPLSLALDGQKRLWIGTATGGLYIYDHPQP